MVPFSERRHRLHGDEVPEARILQEDDLMSERVCPCYQNLEDVITDTFVVPDEEEGVYIRYLGIEEKCKLCGRVVHSYTDIDDATEEDYRRYLAKRVRGGAVFCPYCRDLFDSELWLDIHILSFHTGTIRKEGVQ